VSLLPQVLQLLLLEVQLLPLEVQLPLLVQPPMPLRVMPILLSGTWALILQLLLLHLLVLCTGIRLAT
jgi:hypothetical protein